MECVLSIVLSYLDKFPVNSHIDPQESLMGKRGLQTTSGLLPDFYFLDYFCKVVKSFSLFFNFRDIYTHTGE